MTTSITLTSGCATEIREGEVIEVSIYNGFWKVFWHWIVQKKLRRCNRYKVTAVSQTTITVE